MVKKNDDVILAEMLGMFRTRQYVPSSWQIAASDGTGVAGGGSAGDDLLLENGDYLLLENGDNLLLE